MNQLEFKNVTFDLTLYWNRADFARVGPISDEASHEFTRSNYLELVIDVNLR
jgi:hypothetical protein